MELKLFGRSLFEFRGSLSSHTLQMAEDMVAESKFLPDFYKDRGGGGWDNPISNYVIMSTTTSDSSSLSGGMVAIPKGQVAKEDKPAEDRPSPKKIFELRALHDESFKLNVDPEYVDKQIQDFKDKLELIKSEEYDMRNGVKEIASVLKRMENRRRYPEVATLFEEYPYTTTTKIDELVKKHGHLKLGQVAQFLADMPKEAAATMKTYNKAVDKLCGKQAVFYIIADKKDFEKSNSRRDPILLAQSPFGHVWQILGAWDEEMLLIEEL